MSLEIHGLDLRLAKKMLFTGVNLRIDKPNLVVYVIDEAGLFIEGADVNILSSGHNLNSVTDALGTALTRFMPAINNTLTVSKDGYATSTQIIYNETPSTLSVYVQLYPSEIRLKVVNNQNEPIEGATCRVLNTFSPDVDAVEIWPLNEGGGIVAGGYNGLDGAILGASWASGTLFGGTENFPFFDGTDDSVLMLNNVSVKGLQSFTLEMWFRPTISGGIRRLWDEATAGSATSNRMALLSSVNDNRLRLQGRANDTDGNTIWLQSATTLTTNTWYHVAAVYDAANGRAVLYLNGVPNVTNNSVANKTFTNANPIAPPRLGSQTGGTANVFPGNIAEVRFWNVARTDEQIQAFWDKRIFPTLGGYDSTPYDSQTTNANGLTTLNYQINTLHGLEVTLPGKRRFIMPFERTARGLLDWQVMLSDYLATFATDRGNILINSEPENNDANFLIE